MQTRKIGSLDVSVIGLGTNNFGTRLDQEQTSAVINAALDAGVNHIDTADTYGKTQSEQFIGKALGTRRDEVLIATKFGMAFDDAHTGGGKPDYLRFAIEDSLGRLGTDRIDLYILHRPDANTPIADTLGALDELVKAGKIRELGCSNFSVAQLKEAEAVVAPGAARFVNVQNKYSLLEQGTEEHDVLAECQRPRIGYVPHSPLAKGLLTGKFRRGEAVPEGTRIAMLADDQRNKMLNDQNLDTVEALIEFSAQRGHSLTDLAFAWLLADRAVASVIAGASTPAQLHANAAAGDWTLTADDLAEIDKVVSIS